MPDRGSEWCEVVDDKGDIVDAFWWKRCEVGGCPNMICKRLSPILCWPHAGGLKSLDEMLANIEGPVLTPQE